MTQPSIKGTIFCPVAEEVRKLRDSGRVSEDRLGAELEKQDIELLDKADLTASWYPISTYARLLDLLCQVEANGAASYYESRGHMSAKRLMEAGMYSQLDLLDSIADQNLVDTPEAEQAALRAYRKRLAVVISLARSIYNVGEWTVIDDEEHPGRVMIEVTEASDYSDGMIGAIVGFLDECANAVSEKIGKLYQSERPDRDRVRIRMRHDLYALRRKRQHDRA
jgi:hypothetical protein